MTEPRSAYGHDASKPFNCSKCGHVLGMVEKAITEEEYLRPISGMAIKIVGFSLLKCPVCKFWSTWRGRGTPLITLDLGG